MATIEQMKKTLDKHLQAFSAGDWNGYKQILTDDAVYEEEATGRRIQGAEQVIQSVKGWKEAFPDLKATIKDVVASGDALVVELDWEGTQDGPLAGPFGQIPATHKRGHLKAVEVVRFDGDRIREIRHYFDLMTMLGQLGVLGKLGAQAPGASGSWA